MSRKKNNNVEVDTVDTNEVVETTVATEENETRSVDTVETTEEETIDTVEEETIGEEPVEETPEETTEETPEVIEEPVVETPEVIEEPVVETPIEVVKGDAIYISGNGPVVGNVSGSVAKTSILTTLSGTSVKATSVKIGDCIIVKGPGKVKRFIIVSDIKSTDEVDNDKIIVR